MAANRTGGPRAAASSSTYPRGRTLAQWVCLLGGLALVLAGVAGFVVDASFDTGSGVQGDELVVFEVNGWHNLVHIASGLLLLAGAPRPGTAKLVALVFGLTYALVTLIGLIDGNDVIGLLPINGPDNVLHIVLTAVALVAGLTSPRDVR